MPNKNTQLTGWARFIYAFVALNALAGAIILIFLPDLTSTLFFWTIKPPINAGLFGVLYLGGAVAVSLAVWRNQWEPARYLVPVLVTAGILITWVTFLHLDKFTPGIRLAYWLIIYIGAPLLALAIYLVQERRGANWEPVVPVRPVTRQVATVTGVLVLAAGIVLILWPAAAVAQWPWPTSPLMVRIFAAWFGAFGAGLLWFQVERDWHCLHHLPSLMIAAAGLDLLMVLLYRQALTATNLTLWLYCGHLIIFALVGILLHVLQAQATDNKKQLQWT
ncbi:MAG: hypothetical protein KDJ52_20810 [Anaerolineae bacterium]|nr:hypothetical protein [Anaerolineae bacterium]